MICYLGVYGGAGVASAQRGILFLIFFFLFLIFMREPDRLDALCLKGYALVFLVLVLRVITDASVILTLVFLFCRFSYRDWKNQSKYYFFYRN